MTSFLLVFLAPGMVVETRMDRTKAPPSLQERSDRYHKARRTKNRFKLSQPRLEKAKRSPKAWQAGQGSQ